MVERDAPPPRAVLFAYRRVRWCTAWLLRTLSVTLLLVAGSLPFSQSFAALFLSLAVLPVVGLGTVLVLDVVVAAARSASGSLPEPLADWLGSAVGAGVAKAMRRPD